VLCSCSFPQCDIISKIVPFIPVRCVRFTHHQTRRTDNNHSLFIVCLHHYSVPTDWGLVSRVNPSMAVPLMQPHPATGEQVDPIVRTPDTISRYRTACAAARRHSDKCRSADNRTGDNGIPTAGCVFVEPAPWKQVQ
jgi:hypothetical protein